VRVGIGDHRMDIWRRPAIGGNPDMVLSHDFSGQPKAPVSRDETAQLDAIRTRAMWLDR